MLVDYLDRGKTRLDIDDEIADEIGKVLRSVTKETYKAEKRKRRAGRSYRFYWEPVYSGPSLKEAVFDILPDAINSATAGGTYSVSARDLYYVVRPLVTDIVDKELQYNYFSQTLLVQYEEDYGPISGLYRDPRGVLYEPHTGKIIPLGTQQVAQYSFPEWTYNKILYIEKKGVAEQLKPSKLAERWDMAIIAAEGYATEAARTLLENADAEQNYTFYVLHDADPHGYNIAYTLREGTERMPEYSVDVIDIGLNLEEALKMGLLSETFVRNQSIPSRVLPRLCDIEREYFLGRQISLKSWQCRRIELNAIPVPERATYIETKLREFEAPGKVIPPDDELPELANELYREEVDTEVEDIIDSILSTSDLKEGIIAGFENEISFEDTREWIEEGFADDNSQLWRDIVREKIRRILVEHRDDMESEIREEILKLGCQTS